MTRITEELRRFVIDNFLYGQENNLSEDSSFLATGIIDSTGMLELIGFLERTYGFRLEDEEIVPENLDSIGRLTSLVKRKLEESGIGAREDGLSQLGEVGGRAGVAGVGVAGAIRSS